MRLSLAEQEALDVTVQNFLRMYIVEPCAPVSGPVFYSNYFPVLKPDGSARFILNLAPLNVNIVYNKFKMDTMRQVIQLVYPNCYFAKIDFYHAYYSVFVRPQDRDWFRFLGSPACLKVSHLPLEFSLSSSSPFFPTLGL